MQPSIYIYSGDQKFLENTKKLFSEKNIFLTIFNGIESFHFKKYQKNIFIYFSLLDNDRAVNKFINDLKILNKEKFFLNKLIFVIPFFVHKNFYQRVFTELRVFLENTKAVTTIISFANLIELNPIDKYPEIFSKDKNKSLFFLGLNDLVKEVCAETLSFGRTGRQFFLSYPPANLYSYKDYLKRHNILKPTIEKKTELIIESGNLEKKIIKKNSLQEINQYGLLNHMKKKHGLFFKSSIDKGKKIKKATLIIALIIFLFLCAPFFVFGLSFVNLVIYANSSGYINLNNLVLRTGSYVSSKNVLLLAHYSRYKYINNLYSKTWAFSKIIDGKFLLELKKKEINKDLFSLYRGVKQGGKYVDNGLSTEFEDFFRTVSFYESDLAEIRGKSIIHPYVENGNLRSESVLALQKIVKSVEGLSREGGKLLVLESRQTENGREFNTDSLVLVSVSKDGSEVRLERKDTNLKTLNNLINNYLRDKSSVTKKEIDRILNSPLKGIVVFGPSCLENFSLNEGEDIIEKFSVCFDKGVVNGADI